MPTGHFQIGDLSFSFDGDDLHELAEVQDLMREFRRAERRLQRAAGSERVVLVYDELEGDRGTFDKMRLRAYDDTCNYTLDIGTTDNNPLGIYVGFSAPIDKWNREQQEVTYIGVDGEEYRREEAAKNAGDGSTSSAESSSAESAGGEAGAASSPTGREQSQRPQSQRPQSQGKQSQGTQSHPPQPATEAAEVLIGKIDTQPNGLMASEAKVEGKTVAEKLRGFVRYLERDRSYYERVLDVQNISAFEELSVSEAQTPPASLRSHAA